MIFFCGLHFLVGLADQTEIALKAWDKLLYDDRPIGSLANDGYSKGESGTLRLIRTASKSVKTHGCKKSGRISDFYTYLTEEVGFLNVAFISFRGNRFNVLFYNGGILYYLHDHLKHFFDIVKDDNKLLKAVHSDLQIQSYLCGCRALGLINKFVTGIHILDLNKHHQKMCSLFFDLYVDASEFMLGNVIFFENIEISKDDIYNSLLLSSDILDETTKQCLEIIFGSLCIVTRRMLNDHLKDGQVC